MEERDEFHVLTDDGSFREKSYRNEQELEKLAIAHSKAIFGEDTIYFDVKKRVAGKLRSRVTDGLLLDLTGNQKARFFIVEYELNSHDLERDVFPQIRGFLNALKDPKNVPENHGCGLPRNQV